MRMSPMPRRMSATPAGGGQQQPQPQGPPPLAAPLEGLLGLPDLLAHVAAALPRCSDLAAARLASRALREAVDASLTRLRLLVRSSQAWNGNKQRVLPPACRGCGRSS